MFRLYPTSSDSLADAQDRPYFLWDVEISLTEFRQKVQDGDQEVRAAWIGKLLRQAKPDDAFQFVTLSDIRRDWSFLCRHLGRTKDFWSWLLRQEDEAHHA